MDQEIATAGESRVRDWRWWGTRFLAGAVGLTLLVAGVLKAMDLEMFIKQMGDYKILSDRTWLALTAWGLIVLECALGAGLMVFYRPRLMLPVAALLLLVFLGAVGWAWGTGATADCGCFGSWAKRTPAEAFMEDMGLLLATILSWVGIQHMTLTSSRLKPWAVTAACLIGLSLPVAFGFSPSEIKQSKPKTTGIKIDNLKVQGMEQFDLTHGDYLLILLDTECSHCQEAVPKFNALAADSSLPQVIAICKNEQWRRMVFAETYKAKFPIGEISQPDFKRLLATGNTPRLLLVRDQQVLQIWDQEVPPKQAIKAALK